MPSISFQSLSVKPQSHRKCLAAVWRPQKVSDIQAETGETAGDIKWAHSKVSFVHFQRLKRRWMTVQDTADWHYWVVNIVLCKSLEPAHFYLYFASKEAVKWPWIIVQGFLKVFQRFLLYFLDFLDFFLSKPLNTDLWIIQAEKRQLTQGIKGISLHISKRIIVTKSYKQLYL